MLKIMEKRRKQGSREGRPQEGLGVQEEKILLERRVGQGPHRSSQQPKGFRAPKKDVLQSGASAPKHKQDLLQSMSKARDKARRLQPGMDFITCDQSPERTTIKEERTIIGTGSIENKGSNGTPNSKAGNLADRETGHVLSQRTTRSRGLAENDGRPSPHSPAQEFVRELSG